MNYEVFAQRCPDYELNNVEDALLACLNGIGGIEIKKGMKIIIKANLVSFMNENASATTHPTIVIALAKYLISKGAEVIVGDSPGGIYTSAYVNTVYTATGMKKILKFGAKLNQDFSVKTANNKNALVAKSFLYTGYLDNADMIINVCKLKSHGMMVMSCGVKNMFGAVPGTTKPEYHFMYPKAEDFADALIDIHNYFMPALTIVDAVYGMEGNGPTAGKSRYMGLILASKNPFKLDSICAHIINHKTNDVPILKRAVDRGLCPESPFEISCNTDIDSLQIKDFVPAVPESMEFEGRNTFGKVIGTVLKKALKNRPKLYPDECIGCKECFKICPAKAITMKDRLPKISKKLCICCFCCQEFCPKGALKVARPKIASFLLKAPKD